MNRWLPILGFVAVVIAGLSTARAGEPASNFDRLKAFKPFLGPWVYEGPMPFDAKGFAEKGTKVRVEFNGRWALNKNALVSTWSIQAPGQAPLEGMYLIGWDPKQARIVSDGFTSTGIRFHAVWSVEGKTMTLKDQGVMPDGTETSSTIFQTRTKQGTMIWRGTEQVVGGEKVPDTIECEFKPLKPAASTAEDFQEYGQLMVGQWEGEFILAGDVPGVGKNGEKVKGRAAAEWALEKRGLEGNWQFGPVSGKGFVAWDPATKRIVTHAFDSSGAIGNEFIAKEGGKWVSRGTTVFPDGTTRTLTDTLNVEDGGDTHVHVGAEIKLNGVKQPDYRDVWKRVKK